MADQFKTDLIDDSGVHNNVKIRQTQIFVFLCRVLTVILGILGVLALIKGNM